MKKILLTILFTLVLSGSAYAEEIILDCEFEQGQYEVPYQLANGYSSMSLYLPTDNSVVQKLLKLKTTIVQ